MGISVTWDTEQKKIIRQNYELQWDWEDYAAAFEHTARLAHEVEYLIGLIAEVADMKRLPYGAMIHGARAIRTLPVNIGLSVVITRSQLVQMTLDVILRATQFQNVTYAATVEEARLLISAKTGRYESTI